MKILQRAPLALVLAASLACGLSGNLSGPTPVPPPSPPPVTAAIPLAPTPTELPPAAIPAQCQGRALATIPPATALAQLASPSLPANPPLTADEQMALFEGVASAINDEYVDPAFNGLDWPAIIETYREKVRAGPDTERFYQEMSNFVLELGDEHSSFSSPVQVAASNAELAGDNNFVGIGVYVQFLPDRDRTTVLAVFPGSPAERAGLQPHDSLLAADGLPLVVDGVSYGRLMSGPECSATVLTVQSPGGEPRRVTIIREAISASVPIDARLVPTRDGSRIGYIFLPTFFDRTIPDQVRQALADFGTLDGLILDNRENDGGAGDVALALLAHFIRGTVGDFISPTETHSLTIAADPVANSQTVPLVVLVGKDTVSYGEVFSGILQDIGRAEVVGQTTRGNVEGLAVYEFENGSQLWLAHWRFDPKNSHTDWEGTGIQPDVEAYASWDTFTFEDDPGVAAALEVLGHPR